MGKLRHGPMAGLPRWPLASSLTLLGLWAVPACAAVKFAPYVELRETYTDNVALAADALARSQFITEVAPGFTLEDYSPRLKLQAVYQLHHYIYSDKNLPSNVPSQSTLAAEAHARLIDEMLFLDASAHVGQQAVSAFGQQVNGNGYANANRATVKTYQMAPTLQHRFGNFVNLQARFAINQVDGGDSGLGKSQGRSLSTALNSGSAFGRVGWGLQLSRQQTNDSIAPTVVAQQVAANLRYALASSFALTASSGYDKYDYESRGEPTKGKFWSLGFSWVPSTRTSLQMSAGKRYYGNSYSLDAIQRSRHSVWRLNYDNSVTSTRSEFLLPATIDTASMLDRLFSATIADPVARQLAVAAYIRTMALPSSLADSINYFSNRYMLQKQFQGSTAFSTARTTMMVNVNSGRRSGLSSLQVDSSLLGSSTSLLNDSTRQSSVSAMFNWRISPNGAVSMSATAGRVESVSTGFIEHNKALRLNMTQQFQRKLRGTVELRRVGGNLLGGVDYHENAVTASLSVQL